MLLSINDSSYLQHERRKKQQSPGGKHNVFVAKEKTKNDIKEFCLTEDRQAAGKSCPCALSGNPCTKPCKFKGYANSFRIKTASFTTEMSERLIEGTEERPQGKWTDKK